MVIYVLNKITIRLRGGFSRQCFTESPMSGEYFGRLIATGEWGVCLLSSCKERYPPNKNIFWNALKVKQFSSENRYVMFFDVKGNNKFGKKIKMYVCHGRYETTLL